MGLSPSKVIWITIPTLCLAYVFSYGGITQRHDYMEVYGDDAHFLQITYRTNPDGIMTSFQEDHSVPFHAEITTPAQVEWVHGTRKLEQGQEVYRIPYSGGVLMGKLRNVEGRCEPDFQYQLFQHGKRVQTGAMRAGFCKRLVH